MVRPSPRRGSIPSELGDLIDTLNDYERRLRILEAPSGESLASTVAKLTALIDDIQAQLDAWVLSRWTNAQITAEINATIANYTGDADISGALNVGTGLTVGDTVVADALITTAAAQIGGAASVGAALGVTGATTLNSSLTVAGATQLNGTLRVPDAYNFDITYTRRTAWWGNDGRAGFASSSLLKKCAIRPAEIDPAAVLTLEPRSFYYRREIERRTQMRIDGQGDYVPKREVGLIAQELDALGLGWLVYHDEEGSAEGIEYSMLTVALLAVARSEHDARLAIEARLTALEAARG